MRRRRGHVAVFVVHIRRPTQRPRRRILRIAISILGSFLFPPLSAGILLRGNERDHTSLPTHHTIVVAFLFAIVPHGARGVRGKSDIRPDAVRDARECERLSGAVSLPRHVHGTLPKRKWPRTSTGGCWRAGGREGAIHSKLSMITIMFFPIPVPRFRGRLQ
jgi:hypothetical protein